MQYHTLVDSAVESTMQEVTMSSSDVLTKGRQTFCPFTEQSVTVAQAYENAYNFLEDNGVKDIYSLIGWIKSTMECLEKNNLKHRQVEKIEEIKTTFDESTKQKTTSTKSKLVVKSMTTENVEHTRERMVQLTCRFASYIKNKERGKKDRRAIASGTMFLRAFLHVMELNSLKSF